MANKHACPPKGMMTIFNRSQYEDLIVPIVTKTKTEKELMHRTELINSFESGLVEDKTIVIKFFLHISYSEMCNRVEERKQEAHKKWKYTDKDSISEKQYNNYLKAFDFALDKCQIVPWHIIPADKKWYKNYCVLQTIIKVLGKYKIEYPGLNKEEEA